MEYQSQALPIQWAPKGRPPQRSKMVNDYFLTGSLVLAVVQGPPDYAVPAWPWELAESLWSTWQLHSVPYNQKTLLGS